MPPDHIPEETDFDALNAVISASKFRVRFDEGVLIDGSNTRHIFGSDVVFAPESERAFAELKRG